MSILLAKGKAASFVAPDGSFSFGRLDCLDAKVYRGDPERKACEWQATPTPVNMYSRLLVNGRISLFCPDSFCQ
jgi:hypothetical protein